MRVPEDIRSDEAGVVAPATGGMSVAPGSLWNLPNHRRPRRLGRGSTGRDEDVVFAIVETAIEGDLVARPDPRAPDRHAFVEPSRRMLLSAYVARLRETRGVWKAAEP